MQTRFLLPLFLLVAASVGCRNLSDPDDPPPSTRFDAVTRVFDSALVASGLPGASFVVALGDTVVFLRSGGTLGPNLPLQASTASEWVVGTTIMSLVDAGTLRLTDTLGAFIPNLPADRRAITVRQLMSHTSGITATDAPCLANRSASLASCATDILAAPLASAPGAAFAFSQNGLQVMGHVAEVAAGSEWSGLVQARVSARLGLTSTGYTRVSNPLIGSGLATTTLEFATLLASQLFDGRGGTAGVLTQASALAMERDQTGGRAVALPGGFGTAVGHGIGVYVERAAAGGAGTLVSAPAANGIVPWIDRSRNIIAVFATQSTLQQAGPVAARLRAEVERIVDTPVTN